MPIVVSEVTEENWGNIRAKVTEIRNQCDNKGNTSPNSAIVTVLTRTGIDLLTRKL